MPDASDIPAMTALRAEDESAWSDLFGRFDELIRAIVAWPRWHFDPHTREDVAQKVRLGILQSLPRLQAEQSLPGFIRRICINRCIDMLRKQLRDHDRLVPIGHWNADGEWEDVDVPAGAEFDPIVAIQRAERAAMLRATLARMDEASQTLIRQFYVEGLSYREIAQRQGVAVNTVGSRLSRCLDRLRDLL